MKHFSLLLLFLFLFGSLTYAQVDSLALKFKSDSIKFKLRAFYKKEKIDSLSAAFKKSLSLSKDSLNLTKFKLRSDSFRIDSLQNWYQYQQSRILNLPNSQKRKKEQLDSVHQIVMRKQDVIISKQQEHISEARIKQESLRIKINQWTAKWTRLLTPSDSLNNLSGSNPIDGFAPEKAGNFGVGQNVDPNLTLPSVKTMDVVVPDFKTELPALNLNPSSINQNIELPNTDLNPSLPTLEEIKMPILDIPELNDIQNNLSELTALKSEINTYTKNLDSLDREEAKRKIESAVEEKVMNLQEVKVIQEKLEIPSQQELNKIKEYENMARQYQDTNLIEKQMKQKSMNVATNFLKDKAPNIQAAQSNLVKVQKRYRYFSSLTEAKRHPGNALKNVPFKDRFLPGVMLQFQKARYHDVFLSAGGTYQISGRVNLGVSGTYRLQWQTKPSFDWVMDSQTFGPRIRIRIGIIKGLYIHSEFERLSSIYEDLKTYERSARSWSNHFMSGLSGSYNISRRVKGESLILYNFGHKNDLIYHSQVVFRTGFYLKKKN